MRVSQPSDAFLATVTVNSAERGRPDVHSHRGCQCCRCRSGWPHSVPTPESIHITGPTTVGVGGSIELQSPPTDSQGKSR